MYKGSGTTRGSQLADTRLIWKVCGPLYVSADHVLLKLLRGKRGLLKEENISYSVVTVYHLDSCFQGRWFDGFWRYCSLSLTLSSDPKIRWPCSIVLRELLLFTPKTGMVGEAMCKTRKNKRLSIPSISPSWGLSRPVRETHYRAAIYTMHSTATKNPFSFAILGCKAWRIRSLLRRGLEHLGLLKGET